MKFDILIMDPPWSYNNKRTGGSLKSGSGQHYETMTFTDLWLLWLWPKDYLARVMDENSMCFMWTTNSMIEEALELLSLYGYKFKTMITWVKKNYGLGYWFRGKTEHCLFGVKGNVKALRINMSNVIISDKVLKHSEKPEEFYNYIRQIVGESYVKHDKKLNILELFARKQRYLTGFNWTCLGKEITGNDIEEDLKQLLTK